MSIDVRHLFGLMVLLTAIGCAQRTAGDASASAPGDGTGSAGASRSRNDACSLLTVAEIRRVLPEATRAERNDRLVAQGIAACRWYGAGKASLVDLSVWTVSGPDDTPEENARTLAMGIADPTRPGADAAVRLEKVAGVGEDAVAVVEKADDARGILSTSAYITVRRNGRIATVASGFVAVDDRPKAIAQLATLGEAVAARL